MWHIEQATETDIPAIKAIADKRRDGVKRFENLRYVSDEDKAWFISVLEQKQAAATAV
jgi:hypothetical protein